jgi:exonuclease 3'-5' domain-containing protein 1
MSTDSTFYSLVDSESTLATLIKEIQSLPTDKPSLYIDLEGINLSRNGSISLIVIFVQPRDYVYLVDVHALQSAAFTTATNDTTLKSILESPTITKVFFDLRNDSDALHHHFGVRLRGVEDIQLMENAARPARRRRFVNGLERCIDRDAPISLDQKRDWKAAKEKGLKLFHPSKGGSYKVFNARPMDKDVERYCVNDVKFLPELRSLYLGRLNEAWKKKVAEETEKRVRESQTAAYQPQSEDKVFGPWEKPPSMILMDKLSLYD